MDGLALQHAASLVGVAPQPRPQRRGDARLDPRPGPARPGPTRDMAGMAGPLFGLRMAAWRTMPSPCDVITNKTNGLGNVLAASRPGP